MAKRSRKQPLKKNSVAVAVARAEEQLFSRVIDIIEGARGHVLRSVNTTMVQAYWLIGREIVEVEQQGARRAGYGDELIERLAGRVAHQLGKGFGPRTLRRTRQFYLSFPKGSLIPDELLGSPKRTELLSKSKTEIRTAALSKFDPAFPPTQELRLELAREREAAERALFLSGPSSKPGRRRG